MSNKKIMTSASTKENIIYNYTYPAKYVSENF